MKVISANVGLPREVIWKGITVQTGIFKDPVDGPVTIRKLNLAGDQQADLTVHGGAAKAVGSAVLMVTQPRMPCYKLGLRFERDDMIKRFLTSQRSGFYFSVIEEGEVQAGSKVEIMIRDPHRVAVVDIVRLYLGQERDPELLHRAMDVGALPQNWKAELAVRVDQA